MKLACLVKPPFQLRLHKRRGSMSPRTEQLVEQFPDGPHSNQMPCGTTKPAVVPLTSSFIPPAARCKQPATLFIDLEAPVSGISKVALLASTEREGRLPRVMLVYSSASSILAAATSLIRQLDWETVKR